MTKSEFVAVQLKNDILTGQWLPGEKLPSEALLGEKFNVSRLSIRNAISMLAAQGLIKTFKGKGSFVCNPLPKTESVFLNPKISRMDIFEFRRILETESASLAAQRADQTMIENLRIATLHMGTAKSETDIAAYDEEFHILLADATQNEVIIRIFSLLKESFQVMFHQNVAILGAEGYKDHLKIVAAIEARNSDLARQYMCDHLNSTMEKTSMLNYSELQSPPFA